MAKTLTFSPEDAVEGNGWVPSPLPKAPTLPPPVYALAAPRLFDAVGLPHATGLKRLYLASCANLPGLGLEGDLVSGWGVAHLISGGQTRRHPGQRGRRILG